MSYLQKGHVEQSFYERSSKSYLNTDNNSFLANENKSFLHSPNATFLNRSSDSYLADNLTHKSYLNPSDVSFLTVDTSTSHIEPSTKSFMENSTTSYLSLVEPHSNNNYLQIDSALHVTEDRVAHLDEDKEDHLEESGGETSDEDNEDFSHTIDWSLVLPPYIGPTPYNRDGITQYKCSLSNRIYNTQPTIPERFDVFDFDLQELIETVSRYHTNRGNETMDGAQKYRELIRQKKELHVTSLQSQALEALRVWKHKKEQEMLGHVNLQNADYSDRTERMGIGDVSTGGAAERKKRRELLKQQQEKERKKQVTMKQKAKQQHIAQSQQEMKRKREIARERQLEQQRSMKRMIEEQQREEWQRKQLRDQQKDEKEYYVKIESKNISQQRKQQKDNAMNRNVDALKEEELRRKQQRIKEAEEKQNYVREQKNISEQRKQEIFNTMQYDLEQKLDAQQSFRANISQQRSHRVLEQKEDQWNKAQSMSNKRAELDAENKRKEAERLKRMDIKAFVSKINNLLQVKSVGIDFDEFPNEFYFKYNVDWNPEQIMGIRDLDTIFRSHGLQSTVDVIKGGMTKRAILRKHYQKIKIVSYDVNDILTVLAISDDIDSAIKRLRQMLNQREAQQREAQRAKARSPKVIVTPPKPPRAAYGGNVDYSRANNWGLPTGYRARKTANGRMFYVDDNTKSTTWDDPRPLPRGWRSGKTNTGRKFYINDATKATTWNDPRPPIRI